MSFNSEAAGHYDSFSSINSIGKMNKVVRGWQIKTSK